MANLVVINFSSDINSNLQVGDIVYYSDSTSTSGGFDVNELEKDIIKLGDLHTIINKTSIIVNITEAVSLPTAGKYLFFSKENDVNIAGVVGYYAEVKMKNNSTTKAELYRIEVSAPESSK